jgi:hypothetical protein
MSLLIVSMVWGRFISGARSSCIPSTVVSRAVILAVGEARALTCYLRLSISFLMASSSLSVSLEGGCILGSCGGLTGDGLFSSLLAHLLFVSEPGAFHCSCRMARFFAGGAFWWIKTNGEWLMFLRALLTNRGRSTCFFWVAESPASTT